MPLWGGRFQEKMNAAAWTLNESLSVDCRMAKEDVLGSIAWARALQRAGILTQPELEQIIIGLEKILNEFETNQFTFIESDEDIHTAVERRLGEIIGETAGKLHTGRSRNDQVVTDFRLWLLRNLPSFDREIEQFQQALIRRAERDMEKLMPGYTHLQRAQPILLSHWWLSFFWQLLRDRSRLQELRRRLAWLPLGCGALAGTPLDIDRQHLAVELGFDLPAPNSIDAVSDRDFAAEFLFTAALLGVHLSRLAEAIVLYTTAEFGFFELADAFSTGSSLMPQKKNPDIFELTRAKAAGLIGKLTALLSTLKGLPSAYDKDLQEDKQLVFEAFDMLMLLLPVLTQAVLTLKVNDERMKSALDDSLYATDLADYLVKRGIPFREAHRLVGKIVQTAMEKRVNISQLPLDVFQEVCPIFERDVYAVFTPLASVSVRKAHGGTAPQAVMKQLEQARGALESFKTS